MLSTLSRFERYIKVSSYFGYKGDIFLEVYADFHYTICATQQHHAKEVHNATLNNSGVMLHPYMDVWSTI